MVADFARPGPVFSRCYSDGMTFPIMGSQDSVVLIEYVILSRGAIPPTRGTGGSAGLDLYAAEGKAVYPGCIPTCVSTGLAARPSPGYFLKVEGRSGLASKGIIPLGGIIDPDFVGPIKVILCNLSPECHYIKPGDRVAQLLCLPLLRTHLLQVQALPTTERGASGFGSTGV